MTTRSKQASPTGVDAQWSRVRGRLKSEFGAAAYKSWLQPIRLSGVDEGRVSMSVPTRFMREWVMSRYADRIRALWHGENASIRAIDIDVSAGREDDPDAADEAGWRPSPRATAEALEGAGVAAARGVPGSGVVGVLDPRFTFENLVVGKSNEFTYAAARRVAEAESVPFNPLFIYGGVGLGKTHLMHAIAWQFRARDPKGRVIYLFRPKSSCTSSFGRCATRT